MCEFPVFYATSEGHTKLIAERIAERLYTHGLDSRTIAIRSAEGARVEWSRVRGVVVAASVHGGRHQREARAFARLHAAQLSARPSLCVSVSLSAASANPDEVRAAEHIAQRFAADAGWQPTRTASVAGCLAYTKYNWFIRFFMRRIAKKEGASTDTSRDHVYTNWADIDRFADRLAADIRSREIDTQSWPHRAAS